MLFFLYRASSWCYNHNVSLLGRFVEFLMMLLCSAHISGESKIASNVLFPHGGLGVIIHPDVVIGTMSIINTKVTLGNAFPHINGAPKIGRHVYIGTGAFIGGDVTIGDYVIIGANSVVTKSINGYVVVSGNPAKERRAITNSEIELLNWESNIPIEDAESL